jgi:signal transduction histidine kinase
MDRSGPDAPIEPIVLERMHRSVHRMTRMVNALLDFARSREGVGIPIERKAMDLGALCREVLDELSVAYPNRETVLEVDRPALGAWDKDRLAQVVSNLVANAIQYGDDRAVRVRVTGSESTVCLEVQNWGQVISPDDLAFLFDPFRSAQPPERRRSQNLGLGLYIVREVVLAHGGSVDARSSEAEGTVFAVRLPRNADAEAAR